MKVRALRLLVTLIYEYMTLNKTLAGGVQKKISFLFKGKMCANERLPRTVICLLFGRTPDLFITSPSSFSSSSFLLREEYY